MAIVTNPIPVLTVDELSDLVSSVNNDTITWGTGASYPGFGAVPGPTTFGPNVSGGTGYTYTTNTTSPWIANGITGTNPAMVVNQSGSIEIKGEDADIKINGKSMVTWMEAVEERLNILTPNPELEKDWDELQELGERYRALERK